MPGFAIPLSTRQRRAATEREVVSAVPAGEPVAFLLLLLRVVAGCRFVQRPMWGGRGGEVAFAGQAAADLDAAGAVAGEPGVEGVVAEAQCDLVRDDTIPDALFPTGSLKFTPTSARSSISQDRSTSLDYSSELAGRRYRCFLC